MSEQPPTTRPPNPIPRDQITITLESAGIGPPTVVRVRRALKGLLRGYGLRAVRVNLPPDGPAVAAEKGGGR
jgi:hypothetical protein